MRRLDVYLQRARIRRVTDRLRTGSHVLDIGCHRGELRDALVGKGCTYFGMDPEVVNPSDRLIRGVFPNDVPPSWHERSFDVVAALAVLEHVSVGELGCLFDEVRRLLKPGGTLIATVPSPCVDPLLTVLSKLRLIDGMDLDAHDGLSIEQLKEAAASAGLELAEHRRFQFRLNNLLVWMS